MPFESPMIPPTFPPPYGYVSLDTATGGVVVIDPIAHTVIPPTLATGRAGEEAVAPLRTLVFVSTSGNTVQVIKPGKPPTLVGAITVGSPRGIAFTRDGTLGYVVNSDATVSVIDTATLTELAKIPVDPRPWGIVVTPDMKRAYVTAIKGAGVVVVLDLTTRTRITTIAVGTNPERMAMTPNGRYIYLTHNLQPFISVIDTATDRVLTTIAVPSGSYASDVAVTPDGKRVYASLWSSDSVVMIDVTTNRVTGNIKVTSRPLSFPSSVAATPDNRFVCATLPAEGVVSVIDTVQNTVVPPNIDVGVGASFVRFGPPLASHDSYNFYIAGPGTDTLSIDPDPHATAVFSVHPTGGRSPYCVAAAPDGRRVYVANHGSHDLSVVDLFTNTVLKRVATGRNPLGVAISPDSTRAYVANSGGSGSLSVIDTRSLADVIPPVAVGTTPSRVAVSPDGGRVYVTNQTDNSLSVFDVGSATVIRTLTGFDSPAGVAAAPDGGRVYVCNFGLNTVSVIDAATLTLLAPIRVGSQPSGIAITSDGRFIYVTNVRDKTMSVVEAASQRVLGTVRVGDEPYGVAVSPDGREIRVTNAGSETLSYISFAAPSTWTVYRTETLGGAGDVAMGNVWRGYRE